MQPKSFKNRQLSLQACIDFIPLIIFHMDAHMQTENNQTQQKIYPPHTWISLGYNKYIYISKSYQFS